MMRFAALILAMVAVSPATAQTTAPSVTTAETIDPARLAAAQSVIEQILPASQREAMMDAMIRPMIANISQSFDASPEFAKLMAQKPQSKVVLQRFIVEEQERSLRTVKASLPVLVDAMGRAYARRFTVAQLQDIRQFFDTPTGRLYVQQSMTIMSDPDVMAAQRDMMAKSMEGLPDRVTALTKELVAGMPEEAAE